MRNKHPNGLLPEDQEHASIFKDVKYLIEANHNETHTLWERFHDKPAYPETIYVKDWKEISMGRIVTIGYLMDRPIAVELYFAILNGSKVAFYEGCSALVDHNMIEQWLRLHTQVGKTNATNFHHCLSELGIYDDVKKEQAKKP